MGKNKHKQKHKQMPAKFAELQKGNKGIPSPGSILPLEDPEESNKDHLLSRETVLGSTSTPDAGQAEFKTVEDWKMFPNTITALQWYEFTNDDWTPPTREETSRLINRMAEAQFGADLLKDDEVFNTAFRMVFFILDPFYNYLGYPGTIAPRFRRVQEFANVIVSAEIVAIILGDLPSDFHSKLMPGHGEVVLKGLTFLKHALSEKDIKYLKELAHETIKRAGDGMEKLFDSRRSERPEEWNNEDLDKWYLALGRLQLRLMNQ